MVELEDELIEELKALGIPFEGLPEGAKPLKMKDYYAFDIVGKRVIFEPVDGYYKVRKIISMPSLS